MSDPHRTTDEEYLAWVRTQPCAVCKAPADDPHHLQSRGAGGSDYTALPMCRGHHRELHTMADSTFESEYRINLWREVCRHLTRYLAQHDQSND